jgi:predicted unusual protein kinase regulating ubiquinone biosynthesis (AarF/ABC1/UbiB family)
MPIAEAPCYDPLAISEHYRQRPLAVKQRWFEVLFSLGRFVLLRWWDNKTGQTEQLQSQRAVQLREILTRLGPAYIKIGQALSTRPDLVPPVYLEELAKLQDQLPPFDNAVAYQFIQEELGALPADIYAELTPNPVAAASLGQVYKGKLKTGEVVAVKVQRPDLAEGIALDAYILRSWAVWIQRRFRIAHNNDLVAIIDEFATRLFEEMDYVREGHNAERFAQLYGSLSGVYVPQIYWQYTQRRVLTMEWIDGIKLTNAEALQAAGIDARHLIEVGVQCSIRQLLGHGFFHADPHPGNLLAMVNGKLAYLDFGMMSEIQPYQCYGLINAVVHIINREFEGLIEDYITLEFLPADTDRDPLLVALPQVFDYAAGASVSELNFQSIVHQLSELMYEFPFRVPAYYALITRSLVTLEGIAMGIMPDYKVLATAAPYVAQRLLTDPSPELRDSFSNLLFKEEKFRWKRLANLLGDARSSEEYSRNETLVQVVNFLFSDSGQFIRNRLADELIAILDGVGEKLQKHPLMLLKVRQELVNGDGSALGIEPETFEHLKRIWRFVQVSPDSKPGQGIELMRQLLGKPETLQFAYQVLDGLKQRAMARLLREWLPSLAS